MALGVLGATKLRFAKFLGVGAIACAAFLALPVSASTIDWTLSGVTFDDGGTATGTFSIDSATGLLTAYDITTTTGATLSGSVYDSTTSSISCQNCFLSNSFILNRTDLSFAISLSFNNPLITPGASLLILLAPSDFPSGSWECAGASCDLIRVAVSGEATSATPLPAALPLFATGIGALGLLGWRRKRRQLSAKS